MNNMFELYIKTDIISIGAISRCEWNERERRGKGTTREEDAEEEEEGGGGRRILTSMSHTQTQEV